MGLACIRIPINPLVLISNRQVTSHLFWRAALASVRFVRKVFWEGCKQTGVSDIRPGSMDRWTAERTMADLSVCLGTLTVLGLPCCDYGFVGNPRKLYTLSHGYSDIPTITGEGSMNQLITPGLTRRSINSKAQPECWSSNGCPSLPLLPSPPRILRTQMFQSSSLTRLTSLRTAR